MGWLLSRAEEGTVAFATGVGAWEGVVWVLDGGGVSCLGRVSWGGDGCDVLHG